MTHRLVFSCALLSLVSAFAAPVVNTLAPSDGSTIGSFASLSVTFNEAVTGVDANDISINNDSALSVSGSGAGPYVFTFTQPPAGIVSVSWEPDHGIAGLGTGAFAPPGGYTFTLNDTIAPTVGKLRTSQTADGTIDDTVPVPGATVSFLSSARVTFSEPVTGVDAGDLLVNGTPATGMIGSGAGPYDFTFAAPAQGSVSFLWLAGHGIQDAVGNAFAGGGWNVNLTTVGLAGSVKINEFLAANATGIADENADQEDWIEILNQSGTPVNLAGWTLTNDPDNPRKWVFPARTLANNAYLVVYASGKDRKPASGNLHTNFKLTESGGYLAIYSPTLPAMKATEFPYDYSPTGTTEFPPQRYDYSFGVEGGPIYKYYTPPTPGSANSATFSNAIAAPPNASVRRGFFKDPFTVVLSGAPGATVRYTLDGSIPNAASTQYTTPISVNATTVLRMVAFAPNYVPSAVVTHSYIFLDNIFAQPSPPYDNPANAGDNSNPQPPSVGGVALPVAWGSNGTGAFPGQITNLTANQVPADYGMDPKIWNDPNLYNDAGVINASGRTNLDRMNSALREIPIVSVVMKNDDMWGPTGTGLYPNSSESSKPDLTKSCSLEMILPDGSTAFTATCGIDLHGNASRAPYKNPKHGFTLKFKGDYGGGKLEYPVFTDSPVHSHDKLILRADFNYSWRHQDNTGQRPFGNRVRDAWSKDTFRAMGQTAGHHRYVNLFINGIYWGSYDLAEDEGDNFGADYYGGDKSDYDVMEQGILKSGTSTAYNAMTAIAAPIDNPKYEQMKTYLEVPEFIDYMLLHFFVGHTDWGDNINKNWYAVRNWRKNGTYKFLPWDMENLLGSPTENRIGVGAPAGGLHPKLIGNAQYKLDFADRVHRHLVSPDGALQPGANIGRLNKWNAIMNAGQHALESARWGDYRRDVHRYTANSGLVYTWNGRWFEGGATQTSTTNWLAETTRLTNTYFPARTANVLGQLRTATLYPTLNAPEIRNNTTNVPLASQRVAAGFVVKFANATPAPGGTTNAATYYYTTNGVDPRVYYSGAVAAGAVSVAPNATLTINTTTTLKVRGFDGANWSALNEQTFAVGFTPQTVKITEIHYRPPTAQGSDASEFIEFQNIGTADVDMSGWSVDGVEFIFPQGFKLGAGSRVVIASNNAPATFATQFPGIAVLGFFGGNLSNNGEHIALLDAAGRTVCAVDYNDNYPWPDSPDGGGYTLEIIDPAGDPASPMNWKASNNVKGTPGAANSTLPSSSVSISEFFAKNAGAYVVSGVNPGFVELYNSGASSVDLTGWVLSGAVTVGIPNGTTIAPGGYLLIHCSPIVLPGIVVIGALPQSGFLRLTNDAGATVDGVQYGPQAPNYSFSRIGGAWTLGHPTAGAANAVATTAAQSNLRLNEWLANPVPGYDDWLEFTNIHATLPVEVNGVYVGKNGELFRIAAPSAIAPGGFAQFFCQREGRDGEDIKFNLPTESTTLTLTDSSGAQFESVTYGVQTEGISQGRLPNGTGAPVPLPYPNPALANYAALTDQPVINEILLSNLNGDNAPWGTRPPWVELRNPAGTPVDLSGWKLRDPLRSYQSWTFPAGSAISPGGFLALWVDAGRPFSTASGPHMNVTLSGWPLSDGLELLNPAGQIVDRVRWGWQIPDLSIGRLANGTLALLAAPTRGGANAGAATLGSANAVRINEWYQANIELYNTSALPVSLGGLFLSDDPSEIGRRRYQIPPLSFIAASGFISYATQGDTATPFETGYLLSPFGEYIRLAQSDDSVIDAISFGAIPSGSTMGRSPDGGATVSVLAALTANAPNLQGSGPWYLGGSSSGTVLAGTPLTLSVSFHNSTGRQWYRNGVLLNGETNTNLLLSPATSASDGVYTCVASGSGGGTASSPPIVLTVLHTFDTWAESYGIAGALPNLDADSDGISNLAEFIANTNPTVGATPAELTANHVVGGVELLLGVPTNLTLDFRLNRRAAFTSLDPQVSPDLANWSPATPAISELLSTEPNGDQHWRLKFPIPGGSVKRFIRLGITE